MLHAGAVSMRENAFRYQAQAAGSPDVILQVVHASLCICKDCGIVASCAGATSMDDEQYSVLDASLAEVKAHLRAGATRVSIQQATVCTTPHELP